MADLGVVQLRQYHRPRLPRSLVRAERPWQLQINVQPTKLIKGRNPRGEAVAAVDGSTILGSYHSVMDGSKTSGAIRSESDLSPAEGDIFIVEYCEERPPIILPRGHTIKVVNYYRGDKAKCPVSAGGGDRPTRKRLHGDKASANNANDGGATGKVEKPPRLKGPNQAGSKGGLPSTTDLVGDFGKKKKKDAAAGASGLGATAAISGEKEAANKITVLPDGVTEILHPKVHGPFIGEIEDGSMQTSLISNAFAAPLFRHKSEETDFLMVLGRKASQTVSDGIGVVLRPSPASIYTVGQTEPRVKVFAPNTAGEKAFTTPFVTYQIAKAIEISEQRNDGEGLTLEEIGAMFESNPIPPNALRQRIKQVAQYDRESSHYTNKQIGFEDYPGVEALARRFSPEGVAAYESSCAASRRLADLGLSGIYKGSGAVTSVGAAMVFLTGKLNAARERKSKMARTLKFAKDSKSKTNAGQIALYERAAKKLDDEWREARKSHEVAKFIYEELQLAPWHLSSEFIDVHKNGLGTGMMKLTGLGDPSGCGQAYSFIREADAKPNKGSGNTDGALNAQIKKITGTENDLRKLTMKQMGSLLRSYGLSQKDIDTLKRWDRVHVIRDLSTKAASDGMADGLEKFARGEKMKLRDQKRMYQDRIQEIWRRQRAALSVDAGGSLDVARGGGEVAEAAGIEEGKDNDAVPKQVEEEPKGTDSDSEDEDDFAAAFEEELMDVQQTNILVTEQIRGDDGAVRALGGQAREDRQDLSKEARDLAALKRQRQDERAAQQTLGGGGLGRDSRGVPTAGRKVIRRRITKTQPDGTTTTTFKFIVLPTEVEKVMAAKAADEQKAKTDKKKKRRARQLDNFDFDDGRTTVGHSMFEEDDDDYGATGIKIKVERSSRTVSSRSKKSSSSSSKMSTFSKMTSGGSGRGQLKTGGGKVGKKKRRRDSDDDDLYATTYKRSSGTSNRAQRGAARDRMPHVIFSDRLEAIRLAVETRPGAGAFHRPVGRRDIPHYYEVISDPIDLQTMRDKNSRYEYKTADALVKEFELMKNNAIKFNGPASVLGREAEAIYEYVKKEVEDNRAEFDSMEDAVENQMGGTRKRKKAKKSKTSGSGGGSSKAGSQAGSSKPTSGDVVLDGVKIDLGDITFEDGDSDESEVEIDLKL